VRTLVFVAIVLAGSMVWAGEARLNAGFNDNGLAVLEYAGVSVLRDGAPSVRSVTLEQSSVKDNDRQYMFEKVEAPEPAASFDAAANRLRREYPWATVEFTYKTGPARLEVAVAMTNTSKRTIADFDIRLLELQFESVPPELARGNAVRSSLDSLAIVTATWGEQKVAAVCETIYPPVKFGLRKTASAGDSVAAEVVLRGGVMAVEPGAYRMLPHGLPRVPPNSTLAFRISLRFAPRAEPLERMCADVFAAFREFCQPTLWWPDRRPIGMLMLASVAHRSKTNPRGWFNEPKIDVTTTEGRADFRKRALDYARRAVRVLKGMNAQGAVVWDIEGQELPHPTSYIGDPRLAKTLAPEMDEVADEFFKVLRDAKLRTGVCIRPTQVFFDKNKGQWRHNAGNDGAESIGGSYYQNLRPRDLAFWKFFPVVERLSDKIAYAKQRWGCTLFYIDTNGVWRPMGEKQEFKWALLQGQMLKRLRKLHPDVLLIPELEHGPAYWAYAAPYGELDMGDYSTPAYVRSLLPGAFSVLNMSDGDLAKHRAAVVEAVRRGDVLMMHGWWSPKRNDEVRGIYEEVYPGFMEKGDRAAIVLP